LIAAVIASAWAIVAVPVGLVASAPVLLIAAAVAYVFVAAGLGWLLAKWAVRSARLDPPAIVMGLLALLITPFVAVWASLGAQSLLSGNGGLIELFLAGIFWAAYGLAFLGLPALVITMAFRLPLGVALADCRRTP
jgi:hypothetical protein